MMAFRRRSRADQLGLRSAMADHVMPSLVGAMSFLAALALAGSMAAATLATQWRAESASSLTVQVPDPQSPAADGKATRLQAVMGILQASPDVSDVRQLSAADMDALLKPWLGEDVARLDLPVPAIITAGWHALANPPSTPQKLGEQLGAAAPGTLATTGAAWASRVAALTSSIEASAAVVLVLVALVAAAVISVATRAGLAQRREAIEIVHGLGALDTDIAAAFARRATWLAAAGGILGTLAAVPVLLWLARLAAPFSSVLPSAATPDAVLPLWAFLPALPLAAALIGWGTTQVTVRGWLRRLA
jgi:cell division transport system permease protein